MDLYLDDLPLDSDVFVFYYPRLSGSDEIKKGRWLRRTALVLRFKDVVISALRGVGEINVGLIDGSFSMKFKGT